MSSGGMKPDGSSLVDAIEPTNSARPAASVIQRWRNDQPTTRV